MADSFRIKGIEDCERFLDAQPANVLSLTRKAMGAGGRAGARSIRSRVDKRYAYLAKSKTGKIRNGDGFRTRFGLFDGGEVDGTQPKSGKRKTFTFYKAYWRNYGTLEGRDPSHNFRYPVKKQSTQAAEKRRNRTGEMHTNFFESAAAGVEEVFMDTFERYIEEHINDLYKR